jgi:hypothetical protein
MATPYLGLMSLEENSYPVTTLYLGLKWTDESGKRGEGALVVKSQKSY